MLPPMHTRQRNFRVAFIFFYVSPHSRKKLPEGKTPEIRAYVTGDVKVGIDLVSGEIHIESEDIMKVVYLYDDLFVYSGLDEDDLDNPFLVAEYVKLTGR